MEIILNEDIVGLGDIGDVVKVKPGYARNYLIPRGFAFETDSKRASLASHRRMQVEAKKNKLKGQAQNFAEKLRGLSLELQLRQGIGGKAFGSITSKDIAEAINEKLTTDQAFLNDPALEGFTLDRRRVLLSEPLKRIGEHSVSVKLHPDVQTEVLVTIKGLEAKASQVEEQAAELKEALDELSDADESDIEEME